MTGSAAQTSDDRVASILDSAIAKYDSVWIRKSGSTVLTDVIERDQAHSARMALILVKNQIAYSMEARS